MEIQTEAGMAAILLLQAVVYNPVIALHKNKPSVDWKCQQLFSSCWAVLSMTAVTICYYSSRHHAWVNRHQLSNNSSSPTGDRSGAGHLALVSPFYPLTSSYDSVIWQYCWTLLPPGKEWKKDMKGSTSHTQAIFGCEWEAGVGRMKNKEKDNF